MEMPRKRRMEALEDYTTGIGKKLYLALSHVRRSLFGVLALTFSGRGRSFTPIGLFRGFPSLDTRKSLEVLDE